MKNRPARSYVDRTIVGLEVTLIVGALILPFAYGAIIWNGSTTNYVQPGIDATKPTNQDRLTPNVWLTRNGLQGLYNIHGEGSYAHNVSPIDTEWAYGALTDYASLTYTNWEDWTGGFPPGIVGQDAVVHLISEDVYLSIHFNSWAARGGTFSYTRSTPATPPAPPTLKSATLPGDGTLQLTFTNTPGYLFTILGTTNLALPPTNWPVLGQATYDLAGPGFYLFTDPGAGTNQPLRFYRVRWP